MYKPNPVDTADVKLNEDIIELSEMIAKNTHDVWAQGRIDDGWKYGKERNDELKIHPCLVEYEELSEEEKDYDRRTSIEALKAIIKLGYKIEKMEE